MEQLICRSEPFGFHRAILAGILLTARLSRLPGRRICRRIFKRMAASAANSSGAAGRSAIRSSRGFPAPRGPPRSVRR